MNFFWREYRDEILLTGFLSVLLILGSFYWVRQMEEARQPKSAVNEEALEQVLGQISKSIDRSTALQEGAQVNTVATPKPTPTPTPTPPPTANPDETAVRLGGNANFKNDSYELVLEFPRVVYGKNGQGKVFKIDAVLENYAVDAGLKNDIEVSLVKEDGTLVKQRVLLTASESKIVEQGERFPFTASIGLIDETEVRDVYFEPGGDIEESSYRVRED